MLLHCCLNFSNHFDRFKNDAVITMVEHIFMLSNCLNYLWHSGFDYVRFHLAVSNRYKRGERTRLTAQGPKSRNRPSRSSALSRCTWLRRTWKAGKQIRGNLGLPTKPEGSLRLKEEEEQQGIWQRRWVGTGGAPTTTRTRTITECVGSWVCPLGCHFIWMLTKGIGVWHHLCGRFNLPAFI